MPTWEFKPYRDRAGEWRWRLRAPNGRIVADSGEGYSRREDAVRAIAAYKSEVAAAPIALTKVALPLQRKAPPLHQALLAAVAEQQLRQRP